MTTTEFEAIQRKIEILKEKQAKASGTIEATEKQLVELGVTNIDKVEEFLTSLEKTITDLEASNETDFAELKGLHSWQFV